MRTASKRGACVALSPFGAPKRTCPLWSLPVIPENKIVAIRVHGNPQPFAVGRVTEGTTPQTIGSNSKGIGVDVWMCYGDDVWKQQAHHSSQVGVMNPIGGACFDNGNYGNVGFIEGKIVQPIVAVEDSDDNESDEDAVGVSLEASTADGSSNVAVDSLGAVGTEETADQATDSTSKEDTTGDNESNNDDGDDDINSNDTILHQAVCEALVNIKDSELPMTTSNFYAQHVKPRFTTPMEIKSTSWKKFNTYLQEQVTNDLLTCKAHGTDPMGYLTGINRKHEDLRGIKKDKKEVSQTTKLAVVNLYIVPHHFVKLLRLDPDAVKATTAKSEERRGTGMLTVPEARAILDQYVTDNELSISSSKVQLDGALTDALFKKQAAAETVSRKDLHQKWLDKMEPGYALVEMPGSHIRKLGRGSPPKVSIEVSLRQGRKKYSTKVRGLEDYDINPVAFSKDVTKRFACAGTVETEPEGRAALKKGRVELDEQHSRRGVWNLIFKDTW